MTAECCILGCEAAANRRLNGSPRCSRHFTKADWEQKLLNFGCSPTRAAEIVAGFQESPLKDGKNPLLA